MPILNKYAYHIVLSASFLFATIENKCYYIKEDRDMGKFFNGKVKKDRRSLIRYLIIGLGIFFIIFLFILIAIKGSKRAIPELIPKENMHLEVYSEWPDKEDFFEKISNYNIDLITIDYGEFDVTQVGEYPVTINAQGFESKTITVIVEDTEAPKLTLKEVKIDRGDTYYIEDFIESCEDNSGTECIVNYYGNSQDQTGKLIDYSAFTEENVYIIKIVASDESGNETDVLETKLTIGEGGSQNPDEPNENCTYGNLTVSNTRISYPVAVVVGDKNAGCALNRDLWDDKNVQDPVNKFYTDDYEALKKDMDSLLKKYYPKGAKIVAYPNYIAVLNDDLKGLIGYAIFVNVYVAPSDYEGAVDSDDNLILSYYINSDHSRTYNVNKYNLK